MKQPYLVGICGGSASGKSFLLKQILEQIPSEKVSLISQDNYYLPLEQQQRDEEGLVNFDHPESVNLEQFYQDIDRLMRGNSISIKEYTFNNPNKIPRTFHYEPTPIVIVEGLFIFHHRELSKLIDLKLFVEAKEHIRIERRIRRDMETRGYPLHEIMRDYRKFVAPMYKKYVEPYRDECDLIIPNNQHLYKALNVVVNHLKVVVGG